MNVLGRRRDQMYVAGRPIDQIDVQFQRGLLLGNQGFHASNSALPITELLVVAYVMD